jgi:hypothetical protein
MRNAPIASACTTAAAPKSQGAEPASSACGANSRINPNAAGANA